MTSQRLPTNTDPRPADGRATLFALVAAAVFAFVYYRASFRLGFDWGDMGSYAQYVRDLMVGARTVGDHVGYGPLWYFLGLALFQSWGPDFVALLALFQVFIFVSAVLIYLSVREACGSRLAAALVLFCVLCVPPFYASTIRMLSLALFAYPFVLYAKAPRARETLALAAAAAAIGLNFLLRPDFGYFYTAALAIMVLVRAFDGPLSLRQRVQYVGRGAAIAILTVLLVMAPILLHAAAVGYLKPFLADLFSYPARFLFFLQHSGVEDALKEKGQSASFLRILPVGAIIHGTAAERSFALLIYSTLAGLLAIGAGLAISWLRRRKAGAGFRLGLAVLMLATIQWPGFGLFRPDWVHFISFMHAYLIAAGCMVVWLCRDARTAPPARRGLGYGAAAVLVLQAALFVIHGVFADPSGWWQRRAGRTDVFHAGNGVSQFVTPAEKQIYETIAGIIERNSKPGDTIVCVPYCAGFAFMTDRRILFREHYVDDGTPLLYPGWIDRAIAQTQSVKPPVVIVLDWAPNETTQSRFDVWAARYIDYLRQNYARSQRFAMGTIWLRDAAAAVPTRLETVLAYGPEATFVGESFNRQPGGDSAIWMKLAEPAGPDAVIFLDDQPLKTFVDGAVVTALVPAGALAEPKRSWLRIVNETSGLQTRPVPFDVRAR